MKSTNYFKFLTLALALIFFAACSNRRNKKEEEKLTQKQGQLLEAQTKNIQQTESKIHNILGEIESVEDSLNRYQNELAFQQDKLNKDISSLESEKISNQISIQDEKIRNQQAKRDSLGRLADELTAEYLAAKQDSFDITRTKDSLKVVGDVSGQINDGIQSKLTSDIEEINRKIVDLENQKLRAGNQIRLNNDKVKIARKKVDILEEEKKVYEAQKQNLFDLGATPARIDKLVKMIDQLNEGIALETKNIKEIDNSSFDLSESIKRIDHERKLLSDKVRQNYSTQDVLSEVMLEEKQKRNMEIQRLDSLQESVLTQRIAVSGQIDEIENKVTTQSESLSKAQTDRLALLKEKKDLLDKELASLEGEQRSFGSDSIDGSVSAELPESNLTKDLSDKYKETQESFRDEQSAISQETSELSNILEEKALKQKNRKHGMIKAVFIIIGLVIAWILVLYIVGRVRRLRQKNN